MLTAARLKRYWSDKYASYTLEETSWPLSAFALSYKFVVNHIDIHSVVVAAVVLLAF